MAALIAKGKGGDMGFRAKVSSSNALVLTPNLPIPGLLVPGLADETSGWDR